MRLRRNLEAQVRTRTLRFTAYPTCSLLYLIATASKLREVVNVVRQFKILLKE